ncbi:HXXEE domain-containing protein [Yersinia alsatica]|uniref:HXXEE domain-containing protein n=1 Tax=Yersinia alsatica TaxID=2890317 RepID=UPI0032EEC3A7
MKRRILNFYRHNWYFVGGIIFVILSFFMGLWGSLFSPIQVILIFSFMAMLAHQVEEYGYPGGFPTVTNLMVMGEKDIPDRYPLNANQCMISNTLLTYLFYIAAIFFPSIIWLGLAQVGLGLFQVLAHGIAVPVRIKRLYNPGLATVIFLFLPVGIYYILYVTTNNLASTGDFVLGFFATLGAVVALFLLPIILLRNKQSKYPFSEAEMSRFTGQKS